MVPPYPGVLGAPPLGPYPCVCVRVCVCAQPPSTEGRRRGSQAVRSSLNNTPHGHTTHGQASQLINIIYSQQCTGMEVQEEAGWKLSFPGRSQGQDDGRDKSLAFKDEKRGQVEGNSPTSVTSRRPDTTESQLPRPSCAYRHHISLNTSWGGGGYALRQGEVHTKQGPRL